MKQLCRHLMVIALLATASCATVSRDPFASVSQGQVWPPPPEAARVEFVKAIYGHQDLFDEAGFGKAFARFLGGEKDSSMTRPYAVAVNQGAMLVADPGEACVHLFDWGRRKYLRLGVAAEAALPSPVGVAFAVDGSILISDSRNRRIEHFTGNGKYLGVFTGEYTFKRPAGIAVDPGTGEAFVADALDHCIVVFSQSGGFARKIGAPGGAPGEFNFPTHVAIDDEGNLLVADSMNFRIQRMQQDGNPLSQYGSASSAKGDFARPKGIAGLGGETYVAVEGLYDSLVFFDSEGNLLMTLGGAGSADGQFWLPGGVAFDPTRSLLFVADSYNKRVQIFRLLQHNNATLVVDPEMEDQP